MAEVPADQIQASIRAQIRQVETLPDERKLEELEKNLRRLESISTQQSVREVTATIAGTLGLAPGPTAGEETNDEAFDPESAQIQDVARVRNAAGAWDFQSVLVDSRGRTRTVTMPPAEGETAFKAFEQIKKFPMAADIYRQLVMPMIQSMLDAGQVTDEVVDEAEKLQRDAANSSRSSSES
jgi:hypothetical protein